jgi:hypothetical protein
MNSSGVSSVRLTGGSTCLFRVVMGSPLSAGIPRRQDRRRAIASGGREGRPDDCSRIADVALRSVMARSASTIVVRTARHC